MGGRKRKYASNAERQAAYRARCGKVKRKRSEGIGLSDETVSLLDDLCRRKGLDRDEMAAYAFRKYAEALDKAYGVGNPVPPDQRGGK